MLTILQGDVIEQLRTLPDESIHCCVTSPPYWGLRDYATEGQIGLERTPEEYVGKIVEVFRGVRRVLRKDGTLWMNMGDAYNSPNTHTGKADKVDWGLQRVLDAKANAWVGNKNLKPKDLLGMPWRVAFALQADGWWLRSDIIWAKLNPMPESVTDRPTKAHEYLFLLTKAANYFYDAEAIREPHEQSTLARNQYGRNPVGPTRQPQTVTKLECHETGRNKRSVWTVATAPYPEAHFATYPPDLIKPCILAGTSAKGCCAKCGAPWERITTEPFGGVDGDWHQRRGTDGFVNTKPSGQKAWDSYHPSKTIGWQPSCSCEHSLATLEPATVLDPFAGSGTTGSVALELGRKAILIELNPKYVQLIEKRCNVTMGLALA